MSQVSGIELEKDAAGNNSFVRIDLKKYGDIMNPILRQLGVSLANENQDAFEKDWNNALSVEDFRLFMKQELRKHYDKKHAREE